MTWKRFISDAIQLYLSLKNTQKVLNDVNFKVFIGFCMGCECLK